MITQFAQDHTLNVGFVSTYKTVPLQKNNFFAGHDGHTVCFHVQLYQSY